MSLRIFVGKHKLHLSLLLFILLFSLVHYLQPSIVYTDDGEFREFGVGYRHKTVAIVLAIFSYLFIMSYLAYI